ncbi:MAG: hypothetical protein JWO31_4063 [Phycisphaerales bacterium]|nr:hypothetical protein [Phycisphaerales bacterium]
MLAIRGHFDGKVLVPDEPVEFPSGQRLIIRLEPDAPVPPLQGTPGTALLPFVGTMSAEEAAQMMRDIEEGCGRVDEDGW